MLPVARPQGCSGGSPQHGYGSCVCPRAARRLSSGIRVLRSVCLSGTLTFKEAFVLTLLGGSRRRRSRASGSRSPAGSFHDAAGRPRGPRGSYPRPPPGRRRRPARCPGCDSDLRTTGRRARPGRSTSRPSALRPRCRSAIPRGGLPMRSYRAVCATRAASASSRIDVLECAALSKELKPVFEHPGRCVICETDVTFTALRQWFRDHLACPRCGSIPRERALMHVIETFYPHWRDLRIHEMAPARPGRLHEAARGGRLRGLAVPA